MLAPPGAPAGPAGAPGGLRAGRQGMPLIGPRVAAPKPSPAAKQQYVTLCSRKCSWVGRSRCQMGARAPAPAPLPASPGRGPGSPARPPDGLYHVPGRYSRASEAGGDGGVETGPIAIWNRAHSRPGQRLMPQKAAVDPQEASGTCQSINGSVERPGDHGTRFLWPNVARSHPLPSACC